MSKVLWLLVLLAAVQRCPAQNLRSGSTIDVLPKINNTLAKKVRFELYRDSLIVIHGAIGDLRGLNFLIDTGTDPTVLDKRVADRLHSRLEVVGLETIHRKVAAWRTIVPNVDLGPVSARDVTVVVQDLSFLEKGLGCRIDALIGLDVLSSTSFIIDYRARAITFGDSQVGGPAVTFAHTLPFVKIAMILNGRPVELLLDTAASSLMLFRTHWPDPPNNERVQHSTNLAGDLPRVPMTLSTLALGSLKLRGQSAFVIDGGQDVQREFDGLFNPALLGLHQISFDFENHRFRWSR
ncbi:MAG TPA: retropepsin-like aspartic protease [Terriglobales bacterium]|nr:retropepsin-like aspartic protease [Terriglobales bacterium]